MKYNLLHFKQIRQAQVSFSRDNIEVDQVKYMLTMPTNLLAG